MSQAATIEHLIERIEGYGFAVSAQTEDELRRLFELREQALVGEMVGGTPAVLALQRAFDDRSSESHAALYPLSKQGMFGLSDWQTLYLPYLQQLTDLLNQNGDRAPGEFPGSSELPPFLQAQNMRYVLVRLAHNYRIKRNQLVGAPEEIM